jgi:hypothetical protein
MPCAVRKANAAPFEVRACRAIAQIVDLNYIAVRNRLLTVLDHI